jgi:pyruvate,water dikinase
MAADEKRVVWFENLRRGDVARVGGKNASLGEMVQKLGARGVSVRAGFATTADAYWKYVRENDLEEVIRSHLADLHAGKAGLHETGEAIRRAFLRGDWPEEVAEDIGSAYVELSKRACSRWCARTRAAPA